MKFKNLLTILKQPTKICKICFKDIKIRSFRTFLKQNATICDDCMKNFKPIFIKFLTNSKECLALYSYDENIKNLIYQLKGCYDIELSCVFLEPFINLIRIKYDGYIIVPIPSSKVDDEIRNFNHVVEIYSYLKLPISMCLYKSETYKQSSTKKNQRHLISNILKLSNLESLNNKKILIVDDIYTTGSTMAAAINLISTANPKDIKCLVIAKVLSTEKVI